MIKEAIKYITDLKAEAMEPKNEIEIQMGG